MKKIIRLTESDLVRLVKRVINERRFANQSEVDRILDKISSKGMGSLTPEEKSILDNPDAPIEREPEIEEPETRDDKDSDFYKLYEKVKDASEENNILSSSISNNLKNRELFRSSDLILFFRPIITIKVSRLFEFIL
mgnify:CR=1 FL=1